LGDSAEGDFYILAKTLGYKILRSRNPSPGIDFVAEFSGKAIENSTLLRPSFSPDGITAFSVKSGDAKAGDVAELADYVHRSQGSPDELLKKMKGGVIVIGTMKTRGQIDDMSSQGIFCWDIRRLLFYSVKVRTVARLAETGPVIEHPLKGLDGGFVIAPMEKISNSILKVEATAFVDDHNIIIQGDHFSSDLKPGVRKGSQADYRGVEI